MVNGTPFTFAGIRRLPVLLAVAAVLAAAGCSDSGTSHSKSSDGTPAETIDPAKLTPACFVGGSTPIIDNVAPVPNATWNDPHVLKVGSQYWMYASATDNFVFPVLLYRLTSGDGDHWTPNPAAPILVPDVPGTWDGGGTETPAVVFFGGQYHLFWTGYPIQVGAPGYNVFDFRIGHATSPDGAAWTRDPGNPIVSPSSELGTNLPENNWYYWIVGEPGPVVHGGMIYVYFTAVGLDAALGTSLQVVGLTTSADGSTWTAPQLVLKPDQTLWPRGAGWVGYSTPNAILLNGVTHLFYDVAYDPTGTDWKQIRLHHSASPDGVTGWVPDAAPMYSAGQFTWAIEEVRSSDAFLDGTTLRFYFAGHTSPPAAAPILAIGESNCSLAP